MAIDISDPATYRRLLKYAIKRAHRESIDPSYGEDALNDVALRIEAGDRRPLVFGEFYLKRCIKNRIRDIARKLRRGEEIHAELAADPTVPMPGSTHTSQFLIVLGLDDEETLLRRQALIAPAFAWLERDELARGRDEPNQLHAFKARLRNQLLRTGGPEELGAIEAFYGVDLGELNGTAELARRFDMSPGTAASWANRAETRLVQFVNERDKAGPR